jgi:hypothetical protein
VAVGNPRVSRGDTIGGQQRTLDLHEVDFVGRFDARVVDGGADARRYRVNLREAAQMLVGQRRRARPSDRQRARRFGLVGVARLKHQEVRRQRALRPPGHDDTGFVGIAVLAMRPQGVLQRARRKTTREVVDEAVALRLAENGDDSVCVDRPVFHAGLKPGDVIGRLRRDAMHERAARHGRLAITAFESQTAPNTPPCIVTILIAAS